MLTRVAAAAVLGTVFFGAPIAPSEATSSVLQRLDREWTDAQIRGDADAVGRLLTEDFISVNPIGGVSDKQAFVADYRSGDLDIESEHLDGYVIRIHGDTAVMVHTATLRGTYRGTRIDGRNRSMHVWKKTPRGWLMAASQGTPIREITDGAAQR